MGGKLQQMCELQEPERNEGQTWELRTRMRKPSVNQGPGAGGLWTLSVGGLALPGRTLPVTAGRSQTAVRLKDLKEEGIPDSWKRFPEDLVQLLKTSKQNTTKRQTVKNLPFPA